MVWGERQIWWVHVRHEDRDEPRIHSGTENPGSTRGRNPKNGQIIRAYPISRINPALDDLEISQCLLAGDEVTSPNHLGIIANGTGIVVDHSIFYHLKQAIVYWSRKSTGYVMRNTLIYGGYGCGVWTSAIANDFVFENNIIANSNYTWISQLGRDEGQQELKDGKKSRAHFIPGQ